MQPFQPTAPGGDHEDPVADAGQKAASYLSIGIAAAQRRIDARLRRLDRAEPVADELADARQRWSVMLGKDKGRDADSYQALDAWMAATPHRDQHRDAATAADRAENRLRDLHPDALTRYDTLRAGLDPLAAMREVAPLIDASRAGLDEARLQAMQYLNQSADQVTSEQALHAWETTIPYRDRDTTVGRACAHAEARLRELHPEALHRYDQLRAGLPDTDAMSAAVADTVHYGDAGRSAADNVVDDRDEVSARVAGRPSPRRAEPSTSEPRADVAESTGPFTAAAPDSTHRSSGDADQQSNTPQQVVVDRRYADTVTAVLDAGIAAAVLADPAWERLQERLDQAAQLGENPAGILAAAAAQRELDSAKSPAQVLTYRLDHPSAAPAAAASSATETPTAAPIAATTVADVPATEPTTAHSSRTGELRQPATAMGAVAASYPQPLGDLSSVANNAPAASAVAAASAQLARGEAELSNVRSLERVPDDPATPRIDEHRDAAQAADGLQPVALADVTRGTETLTAATAAQNGAAAQPRVAGPPGAASFPQPLRGLDAAAVAAAAGAGQQAARPAQQAGRRPSPIARS